jgi:hypothetical protein
MDNSQASPLFVVLLFILRCLVPLILLMGVSYILRKLGLITEPRKSPPPDQGKTQTSIGQGGLQHGKT